MEYFIKGIKNYSDFSSRARRKEYWMFALFYLIFYVVLAAIDHMLDSVILTSLYSLLLLIPCISLTTRRLHDIGRSGWWQLILLVPLIGAIVMLLFTIQDSKEENEYGENPKFISAA